jgi:hypothetical protein
VIGFRCSCIPHRPIARAYDVSHCWRAAPVCQAPEMPDARTIRHSADSAALITVRGAECTDTKGAVLALAP